MSDIGDNYTASLDQIWRITLAEWYGIRKAMSNDDTDIIPGYLEAGIRGNVQPRKPLWQGPGLIWSWLCYLPLHTHVRGMLILILEWFARILAWIPIVSQAIHCYAHRVDFAYLGSTAPTNVDHSDQVHSIVSASPTCELCRGKRVTSAPLFISLCRIFWAMANTRQTVRADSEGMECFVYSWLWYISLYIPLTRRNW